MGNSGNKVLTWLLTIVVVTLAGAAMNTAAAQETEQMAEARSNALMDTITTTSRKRAVAEIAQSVPLASTPFSAAKIEAIQARDMIDMGRLVPGARFENHGNSPGYALFFVRGAGMGSSVPSFDPAVGIFIDGVFMGQQSQSVIDTFDLESVEVLRGPQGTLFGRNVTGGAVIARTRRPTAIHQELRNIGAEHVPLVIGGIDHRFNICFTRYIGRYCQRLPAIVFYLGSNH